MKKEDYCFTIGFSGGTAVVDKRARARYGKSGVSDLLKEGLFKAAFCAALFDSNTKELDHVLAEYNKISGKNLASVQELKKNFWSYDSSRSY